MLYIYRKTLKSGLIMQIFSNFETPVSESFPERMLRAVESVYSVRITVHDLRGALDLGGERKMLEWGRLYHSHPFCLEGRETHAGWNRNCLRDCAAFAETKSVHSPAPFLHDCWKGCRELVVPVWEEHVPVLVLYAGAFLPDEEKGSGCPALSRSVRATRRKMKKETLESLARLMQAAGLALLHAAMLIRKQRSPEENRAEKIRAWVREHFRENVSLIPLARTMNLSPSRAGHVISFLFGCPLKELILRERMRYAAHLLKTTALSVKEIAVRCGPDNPYYFTRRFRLFYGIPPGAFRKREQKETFQDDSKIQTERKQEP